MMDDLINRQALLEDIEKYHLSDGKFQHWVEVQPSVEVEPVVRCICCKYYGEDIFDRGGYCKKHKLDCDDFDFCSRGEKK